MPDSSLGPTSPLTVIDLFSGCGGMSSGFHRAGGRYKVVGAVDLQRGKPGRLKSAGTSTQCNPTYTANIGLEPMNADLSTLSPKEYRKEMGLEKEELDVLISCAPCTGFSQKNASNHLEDDPRNLLVERTALFVAELRPQFLVMENVKELVQGNQQHHYLNLRAALTKAGYSVSASVHDLASFGLPQRRKRALVIARRDGPIIGPRPKGEAPPTVRETIAHLPPLEAGATDPVDPMHRAPANTPIVVERIRAIPKDGGSWADVMNNPRLSKKYKERLLIPSMFYARPGSFPDVYGRLWWDRPAITIVRECAHVGNGRYTHPEQDRLLSVREMALLQGFPDDYLFMGTLTAKYNQIGDAVPPLIATVIAQHLLSIVEDRIDIERELAAQVPQMAFL
jgi:DNA (cytosine-5)-methyltransferase 1